MAAAKPMEILQDEATCPICLDFFTDPVVTGCGHNFCRACITECWEGMGVNFSCPQCRRTFLWKNIKANRLLASIVEVVKGMKSEAVKPQGSDLCATHNEELKLYCHDDERAICTVCNHSRDHQYHSVIPIEEASEDYKVIFQTYLDPLRSRCEELSYRKSRDVEQIQKLKNEIEAERTEIKSEIEKLHQLLNEEEEHLLHRLEEAETLVSRIDTTVIAKISEEISKLNQLINYINTKSQQPAKEFIKDAKDVLLRIHEELEQQPDSIPSFSQSMGPRIHEELEQQPYSLASFAQSIGPGVYEDAPQEDESDDEIYDVPRTKSNVQPKKNKLLDLIHKKLFPRRKKVHEQKVQAATDIECVVGSSANALYDYEADADDEISFNVGDIITEIVRLDDGWWHGVCNEQYGLFPANYVEPL